MYVVTCQNKKLFVFYSQTYSDSGLNDNWENNEKKQQQKQNNKKTT